MTTEELLKPRYKVIADYPGMGYENLKVGDIITVPNYDNDFSGNFWCEMNDKYPHLFKKLAWYEERDIKDMPEYVIATKDYDDLKEGQVIKPVKWLRDAGEEIYFITENDNVGYNPDFTLPATETDYLTYINTTQR